DEIRDPAELLPPPVEVAEEEIEGALALMDTMAREDLEGEEFQDAYTDAVARLIEAKREDKPMPQAPEPEQPSQVLDLMAALQQSVAEAKASRGEDAEVHELPERKKAPAKKTAAAKKQPAKKTAAKKTAARKPRSA
ncbi:Ku protein, partial [Streptomyces sp. NPDC006334]